MTRDEYIERVLSDVKDSQNSLGGYVYDVEFYRKGRCPLCINGGTGKKETAEDDKCEILSKMRKILNDEKNNDITSGKVLHGERLRATRAGNKGPKEITFKLTDSEKDIQSALSQVDIVKRSDAESVEEPYTEELKREFGEQVSMLQNNNSKKIMSTLGLMGKMLKVNALEGLGDDEQNEQTATIALALGMQERQFNEEKERDKIINEKNSLQYTIGMQESTINELKNTLRERDNTIARLTKGNEAKQCEIDRLKKQWSETQPKLKEYRRLRDKKGMLSGIAGEMLGSTLVAMASKTKYAGLLGLLTDDKEEDETEQETPQNTSDVSNMETSTVQTTQPQLTTAQPQQISTQQKNGDAYIDDTESEICD